MGVEVDEEEIGVELDNGVQEMGVEVDEQEIGVEVGDGM
jgi:hypothetical protein